MGIKEKVLEKAIKHKDYRMEMGDLVWRTIDLTLQEVMKEIETVEKENRGTKFYMLVTFKIWNRFKKQLLGDNILKEKRLE